MKDVALYIHIPFCKQKCLYCDFASFSGKEEYMIDYTKALAKEIETHKDKKMKSIFIGGGTPTHLPLEALQILKKSIDELEKCEGLEFTVEGNPGTFTEEKIRILKEMGVNRLSIGLQAWQNELLKRLGRIHSKEEFVESYNLARKYGIDNINIDLMFGLPGQSLKQWESTLKNVVALNPEHLSCYSLIIEENTPFYEMYEEEEIKLPNEEIERKMYAFTLEYLKNNGYEQYEISNFSKRNKECRHNLTYWNLEDYVGCGVGAHSYFKGYRFNNAINIKDYLHKSKNGLSVKIENHKNSKKDDMEEFMFMGLRKIKGIRKSEFEKRFSVDIYNIYGDIIKKYSDSNLIIDSGDYLYLSPRGIEISNNIMADFIQL